MDFQSSNSLGSDYIQAAGVFLSCKGQTMNKGYQGQQTKARKTDDSIGLDHNQPFDYLDILGVYRYDMPISQSKKEGSPLKLRF